MVLIFINFNMKSKTIKYSYYTMIGFIILILINILSVLAPENPNKIFRDIFIFINWFVFIPIFLITTYFLLYVLIDFIRSRNKKTSKYPLFILPFLLYIIFYIIKFIYVIFIR